MNIQSNLCKKHFFRSEPLMPSDLGGEVRIAHGVVVPVGDEGPGTVIELVNLPQGARLLPQSRIHFAAGQDADLKFKLGDAGKGDRYLGETTVGTETKSFDFSGICLEGYVLPKQTTITAVTSGATLIKDKKIVFDIFYVTY